MAKNSKTSNKYNIILLYMTCVPNTYMSLNIFNSDITEYDNNNALFPLYIDELKLNVVKDLFNRHNMWGVNIQKEIDKRLLIWLLNNFPDVNCVKGAQYKYMFEYKTHSCFLVACIDYFEKYFKINLKEGKEITKIFYCRCVTEIYALLFLEHGFYKIKCESYGPYNLIMSFYNWFISVAPDSFDDSDKIEILKLSVIDNNIINIDNVIKMVSMICTKMADDFNINKFIMLLKSLN